MATKHQDLQRALHHYRERTGKTEVDMNEVAAWSVKHLGLRLPAPIDPMTRLAKEFSKAAREETRRDEVTGQPYRANHAITIPGKDGSQTTIWGDIDESRRPFMLKAFTQRREQMVGDGLQLTLDAEHWNARNPEEEPIQMAMDFGPDIEWRRASDDKAAE